MTLYSEQEVQSSAYSGQRAYQTPFSKCAAWYRSIVAILTSKACLVEPTVLTMIITIISMLIVVLPRRSLEDVRPMPLMSPLPCEMTSHGAPPHL